MNVIDYFENPLPIIEVTSEKEVVVFTSWVSGYTGSILLQNIGEGTLQGKVYSNNNIVFERTEFKGNNVELGYNVNVANVVGNDTIHTNVVISSNGGESIIKFIINIQSPQLNCDGFNVSNLQEFYDCYVNAPTIAKKHFIKHDFLMWLYAIGYEYMDIYEQFSKDPNKERGISNFFVFNNLQTRGELNIINETINIKINPYKSEKIKGFISISKEGNGYIKETITATAPWLVLDTYDISSQDFKDNDVISVGFTIDTAKIQNKTQYCHITIPKKEQCVTLKVTMGGFIEATLVGNYQPLKDEFILHIKSNVTEPLAIEIEPQDPLVKFEKTAYTITNEESIPFNVKLTTLQMAQKTIKKRPVFSTIIRVKSKYKDKRFFKDIDLTVGDFK